MGGMGRPPDGRSALRRPLAADFAGLLGLAVAACGGAHKAVLLTPPASPTPTAPAATTLQACAAREIVYIHGLAARGQRLAISWPSGAPSAVRAAVVDRLRRDSRVSQVSEQTADETRAWLRAN